MWATVSDIRDIINLTEEDISDESIMALIKKAQIKIGAEIYVYHEEEKVDYINNEKENDFDESNTIYYTQRHPLADRDQSGVVDSSDVQFWLFDSNGDRSAATITSIDAARGKITLDSAPTSSYTGKITYASIPQNITSNDLNLACMFLTAGYCYLKVDPAFLKHYDTLDVIRMPDASDRYFKMYNNTMRDIKSQIAKKAEDTKRVTFEELRKN